MVRVELLNTLICVKVYYGESPPWLFFPTTENQKKTWTYITVRTNVDRLEELPDYRAD